MDQFYAIGCRDLLLPNETTSIAYQNCVTLTRIGTYVGPLLGIFVLVCVFVTRFFFSPSILTGIYGKSFTSLSPRDQRQFRLHNTWPVLNLIALPFIALPIFQVVLGNREWSDSFFGNSAITFQDSAISSSTLVIALNAYELVYDENLRPLYVFHHVGSLLGLQGFAINALSMPLQGTEKMNQYLKAADVCSFWIFFSCILGILSRVVYILRRSSPHGGKRLTNVYRSAITIEGLTLTLEAMTVYYLLYINSDVLPSKPRNCIAVLQALFTMTKINTFRRLVDVYKKHVRRLSYAQRKSSTSEKGLL
ncbi:hypothetical protein AWENTII_005642 [Aspergillus wentii]|nr:hypothetical protein MW887_000446 [Aspergillus wentii]